MANLTDDGIRYDTGIKSCLAVLPAPPGFWSYSSLKEIDACPRRYALARASYPDLWDGPGYPQAPTLAALFGDVVHGALETIVKALAASGCESATAAGAVNEGYAKPLGITNERIAVRNV